MKSDKDIITIEQWHSTEEKEIFLELAERALESPTSDLLAYYEGKSTNEVEDKVSEMEDDVQDSLDYEGGDDDE